MSKRVVVTGIGAVTPLGSTRNKLGENEFWENIKSGKSAIKDIEGLKGISVYERRKGAEIQKWDISDYIDCSEIDKKKLRRIRELDRMVQYAFAATQLAINDAQLGNLDEVGFYTGNAMQGIQSMERMITEYMEKYALRFSELFLAEISPLVSSSSVIPTQDAVLEHIVKKMEGLRSELKGKGILNFDKIDIFSLFKRVPPTIFNFINYAVSGHTTQFFGMHGPSLAVNSACSAGSDAIGNAYNIIKSDDADVMIAGGTEAPIAYSILSMFNWLGIISQDGVKPGDINRDGFALGEGAGYIVLEELEHAKKRNARIYSELAAYSQTSDGYNMVELEPSGKQVEKMIRKILKRANLNSGDIDYLNPHGTCTPDCDLVESHVIKRVFQNNLANLLVGPTKGYTGHFQAGAGAVEAILVNLVMQKGFVPGVPEQANPDPNCVKYVSPGGIEKKINNALSISLGFGGHNAALLFKRCNE